MHTSLLNTAALWYCLCCLDLVLFCGIVELIFLLFFKLLHFILCVCVWINAIFGNEWHAWMGFG